MVEIDIPSELEKLVKQDHRILEAEEKLAALQIKRAKSSENLALVIMNDFHDYLSLLRRKINMPLPINGGGIKEVRYDERTTRYGIVLRPFKLLDEDTLIENGIDSKELKWDIEQYIRKYQKERDWIGEIRFEIE